jgi:hypothetical protein
MATCPICKTANTVRSNAIYCKGTQEEQVSKIHRRYNELIALCNLSQDNAYNKANPIYIARSFPISGNVITRANNYNIIYVKHCLDYNCQVTAERHIIATDPDPEPVNNPAQLPAPETDSE